MTREEKRRFYQNSSNYSYYIFISSQQVQVKAAARDETSTSFSYFLVSHSRKLLKLPSFIIFILSRAPKPQAFRVIHKFSLFFPPNYVREFVMATVRCYELSLLISQNQRQKFNHCWDNLVSSGNTFLIRLFLAKKKIEILSKCGSEDDVAGWRSKGS